MSDKAANGTAGLGNGAAFDAYMVRDPEALARNIARMIEEAGKAASVWLAPRESGAKIDPAGEAFGQMIGTLSKVTEYWLSDPARTVEAQAALFSGFVNIWSRSLAKMSGDIGNGAEPAPKPDKRFADEDWQKNYFFDFLRQVYLVTSEWAQKLVDKAEGLDPQTRIKAEFYIKQLVNAASPANFAITNPEVLKETIATSGENLVRGMKMLAEDIALGNGDIKIRQVDYSQFGVGDNLAMTPGKVIARSDVCEVIQYTPTTDKVLKRPLLICPPWINKFYILDLTPEKSFIRWAVSQGHTVFVLSWVNPDERHRDKNWEAYIDEGVIFGLDTIEAATGEREVNVIGYCVGGTLLAAGLALMARNGEDRIKSATFFTTQVDFTEAGDLKVFFDKEQVAQLEATMHAQGYLDGTKMAAAFNMLRSGDLIWPYVVNNYMKGKTPSAFDLLYWNSDTTRMTEANHSFYLRKCYLENAMVAGKLMLDGAPIMLSDVTIPIYSLAAREDHIAPARSAFKGCQYFGGPVTYVMSGSGHIAGVINPPEKKKYQYWTGGKPEGDFDNWVASAQEHPGSWWPHWHQWILEQDSRMADARTPGGKKLKALGDAPGEYVRVRA
jgi:polyhydroxyalkanoate synthase subunit PhaC